MTGAVDVRIRRCNVTIARREGWSWGSGPYPHVEAALAAVEAAVEAAIAEAGVPADVDCHLEEPVGLHIADDGVITAASWIALVERLREMPVDTPITYDDAGPEEADADARSGHGGAPQLGGDRLGGGEGSDTRSAALGSESGATDAGETPLEIAGEHPGAAIARTIGRWSRAGQVARCVGAWPEELLWAWIDAIAAAAQSGVDVTAEPAALTAEAVDLIAEAVIGSAAPDPSEREVAYRLVILLAALTSAIGDRLPDAATQALARRRVIDGDQPPAVARTATTPPGERPASVTRAAIAAPRPSRPVAQVVPALPFLVLAQLSRIGYVDAIAAAGAAGGLPRGAGALGAAVAAKALPAPGPAESRKPEADAALAIASGGPAEELPEALAVIAGGEQELLAPLAASLQAAYAEGRSADDELLVWAGGEGIVCGEEEGLLPATWVATEAELDAALATLGRPPLRRDDQFGPLARALHERRTLPGAAALERQLGAAAGTALGMLALNLWGSSGRATTPLLALELLADLEALVRVERDGLLVSIPRGQRWLDLQRVGMLELFVIPWLPAGRLEIGTW
jgi:hypothetical protein